MADDRHYVPGDFYRLDDRSGFKVRAKKMRKEWTALIVEDRLWEARPAQDFVKGVFDDQTVPEARPRPSQDPTVGPLQVVLINPPTFVAAATSDQDPLNTIVQFVYPVGYGI